LKTKTNLIIEVKPRIIRKASDLALEGAAIKPDSTAAK
jgi:hypothetical protein